MDPASKQAAKYKTQSIIGIINDKMEVGMAKIRGEESAALDVAIIKATLQDEVVPKEKHVRTLKINCVPTSPRQIVNYVIHGLVKRLDENPKAWLVTLKTLTVFHRLMRETEPSFQEELLRYAERTGRHRMLRLDSFADHTTKETWDYSAWIRVYSVYLDERLSFFRAMRFDPEHEQDARESKLRNCSASELLEYLPSAQRLLRQLVSCIPEGAAQNNEIALLACSLVLKEIRPVYKVVCEGILNLVDRIFEMDRGDALKGVELVKENLAVNDRFNAFVSAIGSIQPLKGAVQFPVVQPLPADFLPALEEYVKDAPKSAGDTGKLGRAGSVASRAGGGPRLIVGGPIKEQPSGAASPPQPPPPTPPAEVDLLGGFDTLTVSEPPTAAPTAPATAASAVSATPAFDPFVNFGTAAPPLVPAATAATAATAVAQLPPPPAAPVAPGLVASSSFANPAAAALAAGMPGMVAMQPPVTSAPQGSTYSDHTFGQAGNAFGTPTPAVYSPPAAAPLAEPVTAPAVPPAPFNPFTNPAATVAQHVPQPLAPSPQPFAPPQSFAPPPPLLPQHVNAFPQSPAPMSAPQTPAGSQMPVGLNFVAGAGPAHTVAGNQALPTPAFANPFGSPGVPGPQLQAGVYSPPTAPSPSNPFGAGASAMSSGNATASNPFGVGPSGGGWANTLAAPVVTHVGGYSLKKPADPLNDLSLDLFGKPQAPPTHQPMRPQAGAPQNGGGSPGTFF
ncbi:hypothetical protein VOLCADRAFT_106528 [Volvox carteri f. nagariensis]|uniref:ENTH domain-containing protein n=1 Tax=Volvox carteri f. nagariensis TaxID=3068 RepID=D8U7U5_VOLCA|nr:uncharacterized protein VOLCADRAFT_106528 [Volvox carteri f. nagariensis]EFJ44154.1 hypothetical protein VOLCADRAFT_106528 [Volvox carteri f. nagariensis]|eukprot:XP_002954748.1 hypothetical protein VOLCADRAFT_106528 [Volvox carteri f. nagariensis]